ncbi:MAG: type II secretion system protein [Candidatus Fimimonas sp.]
MKKTNKKGFTIVELVIVIAVIAILAAVLIPTFSNVIEKANKSAALQVAENGLKAAYADDIADGKLDGNEGSDPIADTRYAFVPADGSTPAHAKYTITTNGWTVTVYSNGTAAKYVKAAE